MGRWKWRGGQSIIRAISAVTVVGIALLTLGCRQDMHDQPRYKPMAESVFFPDRMASRQPVAGTVARGQLREDVRFYTGRDQDGVLIDELPVALDRELLLRGRDRYDAFCAACHGALGNGDGMVVLRGFRRPASFHEPRVREQPIGYYYDAMTEGFGVMPRYSDRIPPRDRWAIAAYLRALQLSQRAPLGQLPEQERQRLPPLPEDPTAAAPAPPAPEDAPIPPEAPPAADEPAEEPPPGPEGPGDEAP
jgi:mono/diheme cytochrome c family protein